MSPARCGGRPSLPLCCVKWGSTAGGPPVLIVDWHPDQSAARRGTCLIPLMDVPLDTVAIDDLLARARAGDRAAWDELLRRSRRRFEHLARRMLRDFPVVRRVEDTGDVLQGAMVRLVRALNAVSPASTREYYGLAAEQIR